MLSNKMIEKIREVIEKELYMEKDEYGCYHDEIYVDYTDKLDDKTITKAFEHSNPKEFLQDHLIDCFQETEWDYQDELIKTIKSDFDDKDIEIDEEELQDWIRDNCYWSVPFDHYFNQEVCVDIIVDTGDENYDYTLNCVYPHYNGTEHDTIDDAASLLWLAKQQGYTKTQLNKARWYSEYNGSKFLDSVNTEINNCSTHMNALTFLVKMSIKELCEMQLKINKVKNTDEYKNNKYEPQKANLKQHIVLDKSTTCGLYDCWQGAGSVLEIELEKDVKLPIKYISTMSIDGDRGYSIREIYGIDSSFWTSNAIKEIII